MNASLVVNPVAGNNAPKYVNDIAALLKKKVSVTTFVTQRKGDAFDFARAFCNTDRIVIAGGDGTINEVINGIMFSKKNSQSSISLAIIPLGTVNVLAKELCIPEDIEKAVNLALTGSTHRIALGRINGHFFSLMAGIGFDGETVLGVKNNIVKKISGRAAYIISGIKALRKYDPPLISVNTSEGILSGYTAVVGNARCYGGHFHVTPNASVTEPMLDVCIFNGRTRKALLRFIKGIIIKKHLKSEDTAYMKTKEMNITSDGKVHIQVDGDYFGTLPVKIDVIDDAVSLVW